MEINELKRYAQYNEWANYRIGNILKQLKSEDYDREIISSFPSISKTIWHIWIAEYLWLERVQGRSPSAVPENNFEGRSSELLNKMLLTTKELNLFTERINASSVFEQIEIKNTAGLSFKHSRYQMIHHVINHSSFHRGQIIMMCRQLGIKEFEPLDYIWFLRQPEG